MDLLNTLLPEKCALCGQNSQLGFCIHCQGLLPWKLCPCSICGVELAEPGICGRCQVKPPYYQRSAIPFHYRPPISDHIQGLKYHSRFPHAVAMGKMLSQWITKNTDELPDVILPVPLHRQRINDRGFNQAIEIAQVLSKQLGIPLKRSLLSRTINTVSQTGLNEKMRLKNVRKSFKLLKPCSYEHIALVDDVVTSGSTVNEAARALKEAGSYNISVWAIAKT